jgi:hypothetical protein
VPRIVAGVPGRQRIFVVSVTAGEADLHRLRGGLGTDVVLLAAPTPEASRVVGDLGIEPQVEDLLAPVSSPAPDRGHRLDALVRAHALRDRFRDVIVVTDPATAILLLRALAPDQLATGGPVTVVGLPRADRPVDVRRAVVGGIAVALVAALGPWELPSLALPIALAGVGLALLLVPPWRRFGREALLAAAVALGAVVFGITSSGRFPGGW